MPQPCPCNFELVVNGVQVRMSTHERIDQQLHKLESSIELLKTVDRKRMCVWPVLVSLCVVCWFEKRKHVWIPRTGLTSSNWTWSWKNSTAKLRRSGSEVAAELVVVRVLY